ncbi:hypothetical protein GCM10020256_18400 [Streptomyces thermocoprophilus]
MACHAPAWAAVGAENAPVNQPRVAGEKPSRAGWAELTMRPSCTRALTMRLTCGDGERRFDGRVGGGRGVPGGGVPGAVRQVSGGVAGAGLGAGRGGRRGRAAAGGQWGHGGFG